MPRQPYTDYSDDQLAEALKMATSGSHVYTELIDELIARARRTIQESKTAAIERQQRYSVCSQLDNAALAHLVLKAANNLPLAHTAAEVITDRIAHGDTALAALFTSLLQP